MNIDIDLAHECGADIVPPIARLKGCVVFGLDQLDTFAERIRAAERERCAVVIESMTAWSRKLQAGLNSAPVEDCPIAAAIRRL
jgi:hypothetical protein